MTAVQQGAAGAPGSLFQIKIDPWVQRFALWARDRIGGLIVRSKLRCTLHGIKVGPTTITYRLTLDDLTNRAMERLLAMGPTIAAACNADDARVARFRGYIDVELALPADYAQTPDAKWLAALTNDLTVCVGVDSTCKPVHVNLADHGVVLWVGPSRSGKTQSMKSVLYGVLSRQHPDNPISFVILSKKVMDWQPFLKIHGCLGVISDSAEALQVAQWMAGEVDRRSQVSHGSHGGEYILIADDLINLLGGAPKLGGPLGEVASMGAGLGVHLLIGTQDAGSNKTTGGQTVEANATARVLYRAASSTKAATASGKAGSGLAEISGARGDAVVSVDGRDRRCATGYMHDAWLIGLGVGNRLLNGPKPWEEQRTRVIAPPDNRRNHPQPAQLVAGRSPLENAQNGQNGGAWTPQPPLQPVVQPPAQPAEGGAPPASTGSATTAVQWPIEARPMTAAEAAEARRLRESGMSVNALCKLIYVHKDRRRWEWTKAALGIETEAAVEGAAEGATA